MNAPLSFETYAKLIGRTLPLVAREEPGSGYGRGREASPEAVSDWRQVHARVVALGAERAGHEREVCRWLLAAERLGVHARAGYASLQEYAERIVGLNGRQTEERLRVGRMLATLPGLDAALATGALCWSAVRELSRVVTAATEQDWLAWAKGRRSREVERAVASHHCGDSPEEPGDPSLVKHKLRFEVRSETMALFRDVQAAVRSELGGDVDDDMLLYEIARRAIGGPGDEGRASYQVAVTRCDDCGRTSIDAGGQNYTVDDAVAEMAACDGQHIGRFGRPHPERPGPQGAPRAEGEKRRAGASPHEGAPRAEKRRADASPHEGALERSTTSDAGPQDWMKWPTEQYRLDATSSAPQNYGCRVGSPSATRFRPPDWRSATWLDMASQRAAPPSASLCFSTLAVGLRRAESRKAEKRPAPPRDHRKWSLNNRTSLMAKRRPAMNHVAVDLGGRKSQICVRASDGKIIEERALATARLSGFFKSLPPSRVILETCSEAFAIAEAAIECSHEVRVVPATLVRQLGVGARGIKTDERDARALSEASCRIDLPSVHVCSRRSRNLKSLCASREVLIGARTKLINNVRGWLRTRIESVKTGGTTTFPRRIRSKFLSETDGIPEHIERTLLVIEALTAEISEADVELRDIALSDEVCRRLMTVPGVGPLTAVRFLAAVDDRERFPSAHALQSYFGLTPGENSSSERTRRTCLTKAGAKKVRWTLIQAAWCAMRTRPNDAMVEWAAGIAGRRGRNIAAVALARKIAGILHAIWRDGTTYNPAMNKRADESTMM